MYMKLIEHVIDFNQLPDLVVNADLNDELRNLHQEKAATGSGGGDSRRARRCNWASFADIKLKRATFMLF